MGINIADLEDKFCSSVLRIFELPRCNMIRMTREIKVSSDWFGSVLVISFCDAKVFSDSNRSPSRLPVSPMYNVLQ